MYNWFESEAAFLSKYTAKKLESGGNPIISVEELQSTIKGFESSYLFNDFYKDIKNFKFDDLEKLTADFQKKASENIPWLQPCFVIKEGKLLPTYNFFDFAESEGGLAIYLNSLNFGKASFDAKDAVGVDEKTKKVAGAVATYLKEVYAKKYIEQQVNFQFWPIHLQDLSNIFDKDLGKILELEGTKQFFNGFSEKAYQALAALLRQNKGNLLMQSNVEGNLAFNNLKRVIDNYAPKLSGVDVTTSQFDKDTFNIEIRDGQAMVNENKLEFSDPYGEWSSQYSQNSIKLNS